MDYKKLTEDLREARRAALVAAGANPEDGGTCNFDTPVLFVKRARLSSLEKAAAEVGGIRISKWGDGCYHIYGDFLWGQANLRTRMAEAFTEVLGKKGYSVYVYYAMD